MDLRIFPKQIMKNFTENRRKSQEIEKNQKIVENLKFSQKNVENLRKIEVFTEDP